MPITLSASKTDLLRSKTIMPGLYQAIVKAVEQKAAKTDGSTNTIFSFVITQPGLFEGVPVDALFSEKWMGAAQELMNVLLGKEWDGSPIDVENAIGKKLKIHVVNEVYQNRKKNVIDGYAPIVL